MCTPETFPEKKRKTHFVISAEKRSSNDGDFRLENMISMQAGANPAALKSMESDFNHSPISAKLFCKHSQIAFIP